ncbi:MAG: hypothetical protein ABL962_07950 [Fimbriimonadaceae bacterium]
MGDIERLNQIIHVTPLAKPAEHISDRKKQPREEEGRKDQFDLHEDAETSEQEELEESQIPVDSPVRVDFSA